MNSLLKMTLMMGLLVSASAWADNGPPKDPGQDDPKQEPTGDVRKIVCEESLLSLSVILNKHTGNYDFEIRTIYPDFFDRLPLTELGLVFQPPSWLDRLNPYAPHAGFVTFSLPKSACRVYTRDLEYLGFDDVYYIDCNKGFNGSLIVEFASGNRRDGKFTKSQIQTRELSIEIFTRLVQHTILANYRPTARNGTPAPTDGSLTEVDGQQARVTEAKDCNGKDVFKILRNSYGPVFRIKDHKSSWISGLLYPTWISYEVCKVETF